VAVVHGGSSETTRVAERLGHPPRFVTSPSGHSSRYTDRETMEIFVMVAAGRINKRLVLQLQRLGVEAVGISGVDGGLLEARRKGTLRIVEDGKRRLLRGDFSGTIQRVRAGLLDTLLTAGHVPVIAPIAIGDAGEALNVDGDRAAASIAAAVGAHRLVILSNVPGLLRDVSREESLIKTVSQDQMQDVLDRFAFGRMKRKLLGAISALENGVAEVILADGRRNTPLQAALAGHGTRIT